MGLKRKQDLMLTLRVVPDSLAARLDLADAEMRANLPNEAIHTLNQAPERQKHTLAFVIAYNWALIGLGNGSEARRGVDQALASISFSKNPQLLLQDGLLKLASRDFASARAALEQAIKEKPDDMQALSLLAQSYVAQNQRQTARK